MWLRSPLEVQLLLSRATDDLESSELEMQHSSSTYCIKREGLNRAEEIAEKHQNPETKQKQYTRHQTPRWPTAGSWSVDILSEWNLKQDFKEFKDRDQYYLLCILTAYITAL